MASRTATIWIPTALGLASLVLGLALPRVWSALPAWTTPAAVAVGVVLWLLAIALAYVDKGASKQIGGKGGSAVAEGAGGRAAGGRGGAAGMATGGAGGDAAANGRGSVAIGGDGGNG